ncbi:MAG: helix-turn-helix transcriptional regulator [Bacilli bacterium]|nr:helix-turn-helix transcriptional regulator [Bacilli bacterium]
MDLNKIGRFIFNLRKEKGLSQNGLADLIPVTRQAVSTWELGKSLLDSQTLKILSEIFDVTIDEILAGERSTPEEGKSDKKRDITLNLVDEYNSKKRTIKRITVTFTILIMTMLLIFLGYYFISSYNSIKVYKIRGESSNFVTNNGIIISTKKKIYIRTGELVNKNENYKINKVKLYFKDRENISKVIYKDNKTDILITFRYGYNEKFSNNELKYLIDQLYLEVEYENEVEVLKLNVKQDFSNTLTLKNEKEEIEEKNDTQKDNIITYDKIKFNMEQKGTKVNNVYTLEIVEDNKKIKIELVEQLLSLKIETGEYTERWKYFLEQDSTIIYEKEFTDDSRKMTVDLTNIEKLNQDEQKLVARLNENINKYIIVDH